MSAIHGAALPSVLAFESNYPMARTARSETVTVDLEIADRDLLVQLTGPGGEHLRELERALCVAVGVRGNQIILRGEAREVANAERGLAEVLEQLSRRCQQALRTEDVFARWGGEEFACLLRQTKLLAATQFAERLRKIIADTPFEIQGETGQQRIKITISLGVATLTSGRHETQAALLEEADQRLYRAKERGRNRVVSV